MNVEPRDSVEDSDFRVLADLVIDVAREIQLRAALTTPVVPLTQTQGQVMRFVHRNPGCSASDIADGSGLQRTNVSTALRDLRGRGYITSSRDDVDGRAIRIHATELADDTIGTLRTAWAGHLERAWRSDGASDAAPDAAIEALSRLRAGLLADRATNGFRTAPPADELPGAGSKASAVAD
ncbi:MarR family winged helix-turn-helix transcriptional regulator [Agromyces allii]|uniref:HTH marR-type domain-containing protein n=1 Tax=Agromyces allii TaxID=393607 RepID=A0ABN2Q181_9MICO|nr:MarR family winged helix-turn-helix transcriptional regulator [Agromyces allii]